ncbi:hypothetical protein L0F63_006353 [Massospora cicadina]|nr:hypothetical protein L0F63_006353 [Massospora cicadina]
MSSMDKRIKQMCKPKKGKPETRSKQAAPPANSSQELSAAQQEIVALRKEIINIAAPFAAYRIPDLVTLPEGFDTLLTEEGGREDRSLVRRYIGDDFGLHHPEKGTKLQTKVKPSASSSRAVEPSTKKSHVKGKSLLVTLIVPETTQLPSRNRREDAGETLKRVSREPTSPARAFSHAASETLTRNPRSAAVPRALASRGTANREVSRQPFRPSAIPTYNREPYLQSQRLLSTRAGEPPSNKGFSQLSHPKAPRNSEATKQELPSTARPKGAKLYESIPEPSSSRHLAPKPQEFSRPRPQEQRVREPLSRAPTAETANPSSRPQGQNVVPPTGPTPELARSVVPTQNEMRHPQAHSAVAPASALHPAPLGGSPEARAATAALTAPAIPRKGVTGVPHRPCTFIFPIVDPAGPLPLPVVPALPGRHAVSLPSEKYFELLGEYRKKYLLNAQDTYRMGRNRLNQKNPLAIATLVDSLMWYCKGFHYHELSGESTPDEMIELWSTMFDLIGTCAAHFEAVPGGAAVFGVLQYAKCMICSRIAGLMAQLLVGTADSTLAQHHYDMVNQANRAYALASRVLDTNHVHRAFPELWKHFETKGFAGYPPLRPPATIPPTSPISAATSSTRTS